MIAPTLRIQLLKFNGTDVYSQPSFAKAVTEVVAPVKLQFESNPTSVRTDTAATKARADEPGAVVILLVRPKSQVAIGDKLVVLGRSLRVKALHPRFTVLGEHDHNEIHCDAWT